MTFAQHFTLQLVSLFNLHINRCWQVSLTVTVRCQWQGKWISFSYTEEKRNPNRDYISCL